MPNSKGLATPREVAKWNFLALNDWAAVVRAGNGTFKEQIDKARNHFGEIGTVWSGAAHDAAYERVDEEYNQARKVFYEIDDMPGMLEAAGSGLSAFQQVVMSKIADAEALGLWVDDLWQIPDNSDVERSVIDDHQAAVRSAFQSLLDEIARYKQTLTSNSELVRAAGDLFGSSIEVDEAASQGGRLGGEDGKAIADAARDHNDRAFADIVDNMPAYVLTDQERQALANGEEVSTVPAGVQDYYREFYKSAGKDGVLALNDYLAAQEKNGNPVAAAQRDNLANGLMMVSNDKVVSRGPDGKVLAQGGYQNLPADIRELVSGREEERISDDGRPQQVRDRFIDQSRFADLLGEANPGYTPGKDFGIELGRQGESITHYLDQVDSNMHGSMPTGFQEGDRDAMERAATQYLDAAGRNHDASHALLTGEGVTQDPTGGALGDHYSPQKYDPKEFASTIFNHEWQDDGKAAAGLYSWAGDHTHDQGATGEKAREIAEVLPKYLAPTDHNGTLLGSDGKPITSGKDASIFQNSAESFAKNPELATGLSKVLAPNLDSFAGYHTQTEIDNNQLQLGREDARRLLFLSCMSDEGTMYMETSRQTYDAAILDRIAQGQDPKPFDTALMMANVDAHVSLAERNAAIYKDAAEVDGRNTHEQELYDTRQKGFEFAKSIVSGGVEEATNKVPGGAIVQSIVGDLADKGMDKAIEAWNPEPTPEKLQFPSVEAVQNDGYDTFEKALLGATKDNPLPQEKFDQYRRDYSGAYNDVVPNTLVTDANDLEKLVTGGVGAPRSKEEK
ncbi:TPR repeat region-containing protein [Nocardia pseudobrasiliensis]|uniref:TPR repeat domain-containing protein n=1 Tax=Nocardia pseudobrasiliensis TaxID=45979 RepID=A0A370I0U1_9NOCA|nr:hypothetical protein [Nocardia pseudobrasiliensis]RDI62854.1 hypothetical protein DFR76_112172 [Nocardia pseudobrasiliensis]